MRRDGKHSLSSRFGDKLKQAEETHHPLILDGATGTELDNRGVDMRPPVWSGFAPLRYPQHLDAVHRAYVEAGADIITTCTFRTQRRTFERAGLGGDLWRRAAEAAVSIAKAAAGHQAMVAGSVGPLEDCFSPGLAPSGFEAEREHEQLIRVLVDAGIDVLWLETFGTLGELAAAMAVARRLLVATSIPFVAGVTTNSSGALISGEPLEQAVALAQSVGASLFCINCIPVGHVAAALPLLTRSITPPIGIYANLGFAEAKQDWQGSAYLSPEAYAEQASTWPVSLVGGCCGSTPQHIKALRDRLGPPLGL